MNAWTKTIQEERKVMACGKWIWYPDDFEIELSATFMAKRYERDVFIPPFWKQYSCWRNVKFSKRVNLTAPEEIFVTAEGEYNLELDGKYLYRCKSEATIPTGEHTLVISVYNHNGLPALKVDGNQFATDSSWFVTCNNHEYKQAAFNDTLIYGDSTPNCVKLPTTKVEPVCIYQKDGKTVYDFGKEMFAFVHLQGVATTDEQSSVCVYYGESEEEALAWDSCELISELSVEDGAAKTSIQKAFRYVTVSAQAQSVTAYAEYLPLPRKATFQSSDELLNRIYQTSMYTLELTTREFIIDGIKRDRWIWSGDAYQGYLMNYYAFHEPDVIRRTMLALFGKEPFDLHLNHIMDYTFYWIIGFADYYEFTGDKNFIERNLSKMSSALDYCISRTNKNGLMEGITGDWVFIDWADGLDNSGEVCFQQMLYAVSLKKTAEMLKVFGKDEQALRYKRLYQDVMQKIERFWDEEKGAYIHSFKNGKSDEKVLRYANMFAILYDLCDENRQRRITQNVLKSDEVQKLTTPYMRFYEMDALMKRGEKEYVLQTINEYWGGMLNEGATSFWETYNAEEIGPEKYAMYGRDFGKSLCHAWGASPVYLIGKHIVGLQPLDNQFIVSPDLVGLQYFTATIPLANGEITVKADQAGVEIFSNQQNGTLVYGGKRYQVCAGQVLRVNKG